MGNFFRYILGMVIGFILILTIQSGYVFYLSLASIPILLIFALETLTGES
jgi:hypothetical protein